MLYILQEKTYTKCKGDVRLYKRCVGGVWCVSVIFFSYIVNINISVLKIGKAK